MARSAFLLLVLVSGCERPGGESESPIVSVRDSAGVTIVEHAHLERSDSAGWWVDREAGVQIGLEDGPPELLFGRVAGFSRMRDGRFAVGDAMGPWVRIYDPDGALSETIGGPGEGPGEFINLSALHPYAGDSLLVVDYEGGRWTVLDPEGAFWAVRDDRFYYADAESFEILIYAADGELVRIIRVEEESPEHPGLPADHLPDDAAFRTLVEITPIPERAPAFSDLAVDDLGFVWVREYRGPFGISPEPTSRWFVFDPEGVSHGSVQVPSGIGTGLGAGGIIQRHRRMTIAEDRITAVVRGPLGAETLRVFALRRGDRP